MNIRFVTRASTQELASSRIRVKYGLTDKSRKIRWVVGWLGAVIWSFSWSYFLIPFPADGDPAMQGVPTLLWWQEAIVACLGVLGPIICLTAFLTLRGSRPALNRRWAAKNAGRLEPLT
jgi:hypothetical protein